MRKIAVCICALAFSGAGVFASHPALADKPSWAGEGKGHEKKQKKNKKADRDRDSDSGRDRGRQDARAREHFADQHRVVVREYYGEQFRAGKCPPGLAKKNNGCMPPGQAKKWRVGRPLPPDVVYFELPPPLVIKLGPPPSGHRYVRVAADILLIAIGTGLIVDAIEDLSRI